MIFDNFESIEIGGKTYRLKLTNKGTYEAETKLRHESLMKFLQSVKEQAAPLHDVFVLFTQALIDGNAGMTHEDAECLYYEAIPQYSPAVLMAYALSALIKSGTVADPKKVEAALPKPEQMRELIKKAGKA